MKMNVSGWWRVTCYENNGKINTVTTYSEYYARQRYHCYDIAKRCGYVKDTTIEKLPEGTFEEY